MADRGELNERSRNVNMHSSIEYKNHYRTTAIVK